MSQKITIVGSYNVGLFLKGERLPKKGETIIGDSFQESGGGKGSNQAVAAALLGADTSFVCRIGDDQYGQNALKMYGKFGISTDYVFMDQTIHSGISVILIDNAGNNMISVVPGANYRLSKTDIDSASLLFRSSVMVGFQLENKLDTVLYGIRVAKETGAQVILDPAPALVLPDDIFPLLDYIKPNETEATTITGIPVNDVDSAVRAGKWLVEHGVKTAIVTLGEAGAVAVDEKGACHYPAPKVNCVDATGAGDIFSGAFMCALSQGESFADAIVFANHAAALACTKLGVIEAIPSRDDVLSFMKAGGR